MARKIDATKGNLVKQIISFVVPLALSYIIQDLFGLTDKAVVGQMAGSTAVASIGATATVTTLVLNGAIGLSSGVSIILARYIGQKEYEKASRTIETAVISALFFGVVVAVAGFLLSPITLKAIGCPQECFDSAVLYMRIILGSTPLTLIYNYSSAILRALGETRRPLFYITVSGVTNVVLNLILCLILEDKVLAVAIATVVSKFVSSGLILRDLTRIEGEAKLNLRDPHFHFKTFVNIMRFGIPAAVSSLVIPLANLQIATGINSFGVEAIAGNSAANNLHHISICFATSFSMAANTFIGQNLGAQNKPRVIKSFWTILRLSVLFSSTISVLMWATGRFTLGLIVGADATEAINYGMSRLTYVTLATVIYGTNQFLSNSFQAFGYPMFSGISNLVFTLGFRTLWMNFVFPLDPTYDNIMRCFPVSWLLNMLFYIIAFSIVYTRYVKKDICRRI